jgi:hypothetical protein
MRRVPCQNLGTTVIMTLMKSTYTTMIYFPKEDMHQTSMHAYSICTGKIALHYLNHTGTFKDITETTFPFLSIKPGRIFYQLKKR